MIEHPSSLHPVRQEASQNGHPSGRPAHQIRSSAASARGIVTLSGGLAHCVLPPSVSGTWEGAGQRFYPGVDVTRCPAAQERTDRHWRAELVGRQADTDSERPPFSLWNQSGAEGAGKDMSFAAREEQPVRFRVCRIGAESVRDGWAAPAVTPISHGFIRATM